MRLSVIACPDWRAGTCVSPEQLAKYGARPSAGICTIACGRGTATGETIALPDLAPDTLQRVPRVNWPAWASWLADRATDADTGVGDTLQRMLGKGGIAFKATWAATFGKLGIDCGCAGRQRRYNAMYGYV